MYSWLHPTHTHTNAHTHTHTHTHTHSRPITVYWNVTQGNQSIPIIDRTMKHHFQNNHTLNDSSSSLVNMTFNQTGQFAFVALFWNDVSHKGGYFRYSVTSGTSPRKQYNCYFQVISPSSFDCLQHSGLQYPHPVLIAYSTVAYSMQNGFGTAIVPLEVDRGEREGEGGSTEEMLVCAFCA